MAKESNLFQKVQIDAFRAGITPRSKESREWFRDRMQSLRASRMNRNALMKNEELVIKNHPEIGSMYMYYYDPKLKKKLPFYDTFPLTIVVGPAEGGFYGLNLHYLPPVLRAKMLDALLGNLSNKKYDKTTRFKINYQLLQRLSGQPYYKACFKHYLMDHVGSKFAEVQPPEWEIATFLPTASWQKSSASEVYRDSRRRLKR
jgi:hypothetical protein